MSHTPSSQSEVNLAESVTALVAEADLIVTGTVTHAAPRIEADGDRHYEAQTATVAVDEVLLGEAPGAEIDISKPASAYYLTSDTDPDGPPTGRFGGIFVLKDVSGTPTLHGYVGVHDKYYDPRAFARVLADLPERRPAATTEQLTAWAEEADLIVYGVAYGDADRVTERTPRVDLSDHATIEPQEVLKGNLDGPIEVVQGPQPDEPGGTWSFTVDQHPPMFGVFFIDTSGGTPTVLNTTNPTSVKRHRVAQLL